MLKKKDFRLDKCAFIRRCHPLLIVFQPVCTYILLNYLSVNLEIHQRNWCTRRVNKWNFLCTPPPLFHLCETSPQNTSVFLDTRYSLPFFSPSKVPEEEKKKETRYNILRNVCEIVFKSNYCRWGMRCFRKFTMENSQKEFNLLFTRLFHAETAFWKFVVRLSYISHSLENVIWRGWEVSH